MGGGIRQQPGASSRQQFWSPDVKAVHDQLQKLFANLAQRSDSELYFAECPGLKDSLARRDLIAIAKSVRSIGDRGKLLIEGPWLSDSSEARFEGQISTACCSLEQKISAFATNRWSQDRDDLLAAITAAFMDPDIQQRIPLCEEEVLTGAAQDFRALRPRDQTRCIGIFEERKARAFINYRESNQNIWTRAGIVARHSTDPMNGLITSITILLQVSSASNEMLPRHLFVSNINKIKASRTSSASE